MNAVINFKTDKKIKAQAQKIAGQMGLNLSDVLNVSLRNFIVQKEVHLNLNEDESNPSDELLEAIREAREERKSGKIRSFEDINDMIAYLKKI